MITLETSRTIGTEIRLSNSHLSGHLAAINDLVSLSKEPSKDEIKKAKDLIGSHIQAILAGASAIKKGAVDPLNPSDEEAVEARKKVWLSIKQCTSKKNMFFLDGERPQAKKGSNWLVHWSLPQVKAATSDDTDDHTPDSPNATIKPVVIPSVEITPAEKLLTIELMLEGLTIKELQGIQKTVAALIKAAKTLDTQAA